MIKLRIYNLNRKFRVDEPLARRLLALAMRGAGIREGEFSVVFTGSAAMRALNRRFAGKDFATDVLSFASESRDRRILSGDIFVSLDAARENAPRFRSSADREALLYAVHGALHIAGYGDAAPGERVRMRKKEEEALERLCRAWDLSKVLTPR